MTKMISSLQNPLVKNVLLLSEKPRARKEQNRFVIEGSREISLAMSGGFNISHLFYAPEFVTAASLETFGFDDNLVEMTEVSAGVFNRMAYRQDRDGLIALAEPKRPGFGDL